MTINQTCGFLCNHLSVLMFDFVCIKYIQWDIRNTHIFFKIFINNYKTKGKMFPVQPWVISLNAESTDISII